MNIAIIGAGIAGLACADILAAHHHQVRLFDKSRGVGGRMSTRRMTTPHGEFQFDHGAQYFTVRDPAFQVIVDRWQTAGIVAAWPAAGSAAWVGVPSMNAPVKAMAARHDVTLAVRIDAIQKQGHGWCLDGEGVPDSRFDVVVIAIPAEQAAPLLAPWENHFSALATATPSDPCWTIMLSFAESVPTDMITLRDDPMIGWAACNSNKPGRTARSPGSQSWVIQASPEWSRQHLEDTQEAVITALTQRLAECLGVVALPEATIAAAHRWRYARSGNAGINALYNAEKQLGVCGDWLLGPRVESAWLSGHALGNTIVT
jgi:predicted NAD/FAD-dependent oxidoreductase